MVYRIGSGMVLPLIEINIAAFQPFNTALFKKKSVLCFS